jgi:hypothetical protein
VDVAVFDVAGRELRWAAGLGGAGRFRGDRRRQHAVAVAGWTIPQYRWHGLIAAGAGRRPDSDRARRTIPCLSHQ